MEANLCLLTRHIPAMHHHRNVRVHSSVRLPALQAKVGPLPGAGRLAVVGAGVVLSCALGAMYLKGAQAKSAPDFPSCQTSHAYGHGAEASVIVSIKDLRELLSEICIGPKPDKLPKLMEQCLIEKDVKNFSKNQDLTSLLEEKFLKTTRPGEHDYNLGLVLVLALLREKNYAKAQEICEKLIDISLDSSDAKPNLLWAITNMMVAMESMLQFPNNTSKGDLKQQLGLMQNACEDYISKLEKVPPQESPPATD